MKTKPIYQQGSYSVYKLPDQQNKEKDEKIAELKRELDDVKVNHYNQLNDQLVQDIESLRKENEELKEDRRYWGREYTRLRELVTQYLDNSTSDNAYGADVRDRILNELNPKRAKQPKS